MNHSVSIEGINERMNERMRLIINSFYSFRKSANIEGMGGRQGSIMDRNIP